MDCATCSDLLLDLVYDELDDVRAAAARRHAEACPSCQAELDRLRRGRSLAAKLRPLEAPSPSPSLLEAIQAAARANAEVHTRGPSGGETSGGGKTSGGGGGVAPVIPITSGATRRSPGLLQRVGEIAMRRQVAMVAVACLIVGIGYRYVPLQSASPTTPVGSVSPEVIPARDLPGARDPPRMELPRTAPGEPGRFGQRLGRAPAQAPSWDDTARRAQARETSARGASSEVAPSAEAPSPVAEPPAQIAATQAAIAAESESQRRAPTDSLALQPQQAQRLPTSYRDNAQGEAPLAASAPQLRGPNADLARALPSSPVANAPTAVGTGSSVDSRSETGRQAEPAWRSLQLSGNDLRARGQNEQAIAAWRQALDRDPPEDQRRVIALALVAELQRTGRITEAETVRAAHLSRANNTVEYANAVPSPAPPAASGSTPGSSGNSNMRPSTVRPTMSRPARRSVNHQSDMMNQTAY